MRRVLPVALFVACAAEEPAPTDQAPPPLLGAPDLHVPFAIRGQTVVAVVDEVLPGAPVQLAVGGRLGRGPCLPNWGGVCLGITSPRLLGTGTAGPDGVARIPFVAPAGLLPDDVAFQAIAPVGATWGASQALLRPVLDDLPPAVLYQVPTPPGFFPLDADAVHIEGNALFLDVSYGGGCAPHDFAVTWDGQVLESFPVQIPLTLYHNGHNDPCDAWIQQSLVFDLSSIIPHWGYGEPEIAQINVAGGGDRWTF